MKQIILSMFITLVAATAIAQGPSANYDAANWKLWLLDNPQQIAVSAPPNGAQSKTELQSVKQRISKVDMKKLAEIKYWDAGAPAYRWNQILPQFMQLNTAALLRRPGSWMNIAIYDATILAWKEKIKYKRNRPTGLDYSLKNVVNTPTTYSYPCEHY